MTIFSTIFNYDRNARNFLFFFFAAFFSSFLLALDCASASLRAILCSLIDFFNSAATIAASFFCCVCVFVLDTLPILRNGPILRNTFANDRA